MKKVFKKIYSKGGWDEKGSGPGSTKEYTKGYRRFLQNFLKSKKIKSVIDLGCGDWQFSKLINWEGIHYLGIDLVPSIIKSNKKKYGKKNIHFKKGNFLEVNYPQPT